VLKDTSQTSSQPSRQTTNATNKPPRMSTPYTAIVLLALALSCQPPSLRETVSGDQIDRFFLADGGVLIGTPDLTNRSVVVWFERDGGWVRREALGAADGTFEMGEVPTGLPFFLQLGDLSVVSSSRRIHFGQHRLGRPNTTSLGRGEGLSLSWASAPLWSDDDELQLMCWGSGLGLASTQQRGLTPQPDAGSTETMASVFDLEGLPAPDPEQGDNLQLVRLVADRSTGFLQRRATQRAAANLPLALGSVTAWQPSFETLPVLTQPMQVDAAAFLQRAALTAPGAAVYALRVSVSAHPGAFGASTVSGPVPDVYLAELPLDGGVNAFQATFGDAYPTPFTRFNTAAALAEFTVVVPLADGGFSRPRVETAQVSAAALTGEMLRPGPQVPQFRIDGQPADQVSVVSLTPTIEWAMTAEMPSRYELEVFELTVLPNMSVQRRVASSLRIETPATRVRLPPGILQPQRHYLLRLTAVQVPIGYRRDTPFVDVGPPASASQAVSRVVVAMP
jgi:hypothetical protein